MDLKYNEAQNIVTAGTYGRGAWQVNSGPPQAILVADGVEQPLIEVDGDGDGKLEPGETWSVRPIVRNVGGITATDVTARLTTSTPGITILTTDPGSFGDLGPNDSAPSASAFVFTVDPAIACGSQIVMDLVGLASTTPSGIYEDQAGFYTPPVQGDLGPPVTETLVDEDFDPPPNDWTHEAVSVFPPCPLSYLDESSRREVPGDARAIGRAHAHSQHTTPHGPALRRARHRRRLRSRSRESFGSSLRSASSCHGCRCTKRPVNI